MFAKVLIYFQRCCEWLCATTTSVARAVQWLWNAPNQQRRRVRAFILLASTLVCLYAGVVHWYVFSIPDIGLHAVLKDFAMRGQTIDAAPRVNRVDRPDLLYRQNSLDPKQRLDWAGAKQLEGAVVVSVDGQYVQTWPQWLRALVSLETAPEELIPVELQLPGTATSTIVWCQPDTLPWHVLVPSILWFFLKLGLLLVGALVLWKRPDDRSALWFFMLCIVTFGAYIGGYHWSRIVSQPALLLPFTVCSTFLPAVSLHFYLMFPRPKEFLLRYPTMTKLVIYAPPIAFLLIVAHSYIRTRWLVDDGAPPEEVGAALGRIFNQVYVYFALAALWYLASIVCLIHSYRTASDATQRNQVKWILFGTLASLVPIGYTLYLAYLKPSDFGSGDGTWSMFAASVCVTAAFTISITRYRLMQLDQIISSGMVFFLLSSLAGLIYYAFVLAAALLFSDWVASSSFLQALGVSGAALVLLLSLDMIRGRVRRVLDRRFYREKHQLDRTLQRLSQAVEQLVDPPTLARRFLQTSAELLGASHGAIYLRTGDEPLYRLTDCLGTAPALNELSSGCPLIEVLEARGSLVARGRGPRTADPAQRQLQFLGGEIAQALSHEGRMLALLILGPRPGSAYGSDDLNLLAAFAQITALALESTQGHRTIESLNRELQTKVEKISEQQRRILALQSQLMKRDSILRTSETSATSEVASSPNGETQPCESAAAIPPARGGVVGSSVQVQQLLHLVRKVAASPSAVLLRGESGTGKELLARAIHDNSPRSGKAFVKVHCAALSPGLLESELFGHVKGAFTGAHRDKVGRFELADGGTVFLDEIGDISLEVQTKLLRVLQEMTFERVGSSEPVEVDVRVIAATHQNLEQLIGQGRFRADLYYRLNVISITVPPLRERREDIPELVAHFMRLYAERAGKPVSHIDDDALAALKGYEWPGNIRQLENVVERAVVVSEGSVITLHDLPPELVQLPGAAGLSAAEFSRTVPSTGPASETNGETLQGVKAERAERHRREREQLVRALAASRGNKTRAAQSLGLARSTLVSRLKKHGLQ